MGDCQYSWGGRGPVHRPLLPRSVRLALLSVPQGVQPFTVYKACSPLTPQEILESVPQVGRAGGCSPQPGRGQVCPRVSGQVEMGWRSEPRSQGPSPAARTTSVMPPPPPALSSPPLPSPMLLPCLQSMWGFSKALMIENKLESERNHRQAFSEGRLCPCVSQPY